MKIVVCGFGRAGKECMLQLLKEGYHTDQFFVFTHEDKFNAEFEDFLNDFKIDYTKDSINKRIDILEALNPEILLSIYYKFIIKDDVLELFNGKAMNCHPSLLPDYKGCFSSVWAILNAEQKTGATFHYITSGVDEGNIILQKELEILENDTAFSLYHKLISVFVFNFVEAFNLLKSGFEGLDQGKIESKKRYYNRSLPFDGVREMDNLSNDEINRFVRAMYYPPFPGAKFTKNGKEVSSVDLGTIDSKLLKLL